MKASSWAGDNQKKLFWVSNKEFVYILVFDSTSVSLSPSMHDGRFDGIMVGIYFDMIDKMKSDFNAKVVDMNQRIAANMALLGMLQKRDEERDLQLTSFLIKDAERDAQLAVRFAKIDEWLVSSQKENEASIARLSMQNEESDAFVVRLEEKNAKQEALIVSLRREVCKGKKRAAKIQRAMSKPRATRSSQGRLLQAKGDA